MIGKERVLDILKNVISLSSADQTEALFMGEESYLTGFANNYIHRNVGGKDWKILISSHSQNRKKERIKIFSWRQQLIVLQSSGQSM